MNDTSCPLLDVLNEFVCECGHPTLSHRREHENWGERPYACQECDCPDFKRKITKMKPGYNECDGCGKMRRDVISCGRDSNGEPDSPDFCFICRIESQRGKFYDKKLSKYTRESFVPIVRW